MWLQIAKNGVLTTSGSAKSYERDFVAANDDDRKAAAAIWTSVQRPAAAIKERERNDECARSPIDRNARVTRNPEVASGKRNWWRNALAGRSSRGVFFTTLTLLIVSARVGVAARAHGHKLTSADGVEFDLVRNAMFTLLGLMVGFAISMAVSRHDLRKTCEGAEANAIGTEYLRLDLMPPEVSTAARTLLRTYVDERIAFYRDPNPSREHKKDRETMDSLWAAVAPEAKTRQTPTDALIAPGTSDILNSQGYTLAAWRNWLPIEVWMLLIFIATGCNFLIGFGVERLSPATHAILPVTVALAFLLIADVEGPRNGFVQMEPVNLDDVATAMSQK